MKRISRVVIRTAAALIVVASLNPRWTVAGAGPSFVDITWMSIANVYYRIGGIGVLTDGYITRLPQRDFFGGGGGLARTRSAHKPDVAAVRRVMAAIGGARSVNVLLTGHSHFDHSFDTATWSKLTGARIIGSRTTCFQAAAEDVPRNRCTAVNGGEQIGLADGVTMRVVRWNHSGDPATNPEQHNPSELDAPPRPDPATGGLRGGVAEDFPNGGGNRAFLFTVDAAAGRFSWFYQNSASAIDLHLPIVLGGVNYGAPIDNLKAAMLHAGLESVDLWIGTGGLAVAQLVVPVLKPKAFLPVHWDGLWGAFEGGVPRAYADPPLQDFLAKSGVTLVKPGQYMDTWRLDRNGIRAIDGQAVKKALGFDLIAKIDHLVYATPDLELGIRTIEGLLGVRATPGGQHPGLGTRNALVSLGPSAYLEIIGPDPEQPKPSGPRRFGIDELKEPRLIGWVAKGTELDQFARTARTAGIGLGEVIAGRRNRPDGVVLAWRYTDPAVVIETRLIPYFIDWGTSPHPAASAPAGATLVSLRAEHPDAAGVRRMLRKLDLNLPVGRGRQAALIATIDGPKGRVVLHGAR